MFDARRFLRPLHFLVLSAATLVFFPQSAFAGPDFYGVKMKSEDFARNILIQEDYLTPDFTNDRPGTDKSVYAFGYTSTFLGRGRGLSITVHNHSDKPIATERLMRECVILTNDGKRYDRSQPEMEWRRDSLGPGDEATFNISFPGVDLRTQDVRMIQLSFGLGETKIFLFPMAPPSAPEKIAPPVPPPAKPNKTEKPKTVAKPPKKEPIKKAAPEPKKETPAAASLAGKCVTPIKVMQSFFRAVGQKIGDVAHHRSTEKEPMATEASEPETVEAEPVPETAETMSAAEPAGSAQETSEEGGGAVEVTPVSHPDKNVPFNYPYQKSEQVIDGITYNFRPNFRTAVQEAETETVKMITTDRPWALDQPDRTMVRETAFRVSNGVLPRGTAQVVIVNPNNIFIVFDAGLEDGVAPNSIVSILRDGRRVGKAMTSKVRDRITGAVILPEWRTQDKIQVGDIVSLTD